MTDALPISRFPVRVERTSNDAMELRQMYVDPAARRLSIGRRMLLYAEPECRRRGFTRLELSTAEIQTEAIALYRSGVTDLSAKSWRSMVAIRRSAPECDGSISNKCFPGGPQNSRG